MLSPTTHHPPLLGRGPQPRSASLPRRVRARESVHRGWTTRHRGPCGETPQCQCAALSNRPSIDARGANRADGRTWDCTCKLTLCLRGDWVHCASLACARASTTRPSPAPPCSDCDDCRCNVGTSLTLVELCLCWPACGTTSAQQGLGSYSRRPDRSPPAVKPSIPCDLSGSSLWCKCKAGVAWATALHPPKGAGTSRSPVAVGRRRLCCLRLLLNGPRSGPASALPSAPLSSHH